MKPYFVAAIVAAPLMGLFMGTAHAEDLDFDMNKISPEEQAMYDDFNVCLSSAFSSMQIKATGNATAEQIAEAKEEILVQIAEVCAGQTGFDFERGDEPGTFSISPRKLAI